MINFKNHYKIIPVFISVIAGFVAVAGGIYFIIQQFVNKENQSVLGVKNKTSKVKLAKDPFTYTPEATTDQSNSPPGFTINPPAGWTKQNNPNYKVLFFSSEKDKERIADVGDYKLPARVLVNMLNLESQPGFSELEKQADFSESKMLEIIDETTIIDVENSVILKDAPAKSAGQESRILEYKASSLVGGKYEVWEHVYSYMFIKNKHLVVVAGGSLESAWKKRSAEIKASLNSFSFRE